VAEQPQPASPQATGSVEQIVREAARRYGLDENYFVSIAMCESTMNPGAINYAYFETDRDGIKHYPSGLFQHISRYYAARAIKYGYEPNVFDAYSNANTTAAMFRDGSSNLWECN
jgi:hypothetical protein